MSSAIQDQSSLQKAYEQIRKKQLDFFHSNATRPLDFRVAMLKKLKIAIRTLEPQLIRALGQDLGKSEFEAYSSEIGIVYSEITYALKNIRSWARKKRVKTNLHSLPAKSYIQKEPYGITLIISPWNYPFQLLFSPLVGALAAGNTAILKPSELAPHTAAVMTRIIEEHFDPAYLKVVNGGVPETTELLKLPFDYLFFTGSAAVGRIVMEAAAKHLTPLTLELGGKSPALVDQTANLKLAARKIAWGKFLNAGQTCVAPDYLLVHHSVKDSLIKELAQILQGFYQGDSQKSSFYSRIINQKQFQRLLSLLDPQKIVVGGKSDQKELFLEPTVMDNVTWEDPIMQQEIFGPILPVLTFRTMDEAIGQIRRQAKPLSLYIFTENKKHAQRVTGEIPYGGGCINNTVLHFASTYLPFGGVGSSGLGASHGEAGFNTFSHAKSIMRYPKRLDPGLVYPNRHIGIKLLRFILK